MIDLPYGRRGRFLAIALFVILIAVLWLGVIGPLIDLYADRSATLKERAALADKMENIADAVPLLRKNVLALSARSTGEQTKLKGATEAIAEANLSILVEHLAEDAGIYVSSVEAAPVEKARISHQVGITIHGSGDYKSFIRLLSSMTEAFPKLFVDGLQLHKVAEGEQSHGIETILTVYAVRNT